MDRAARRSRRGRVVALERPADLPALVEPADAVQTIVCLPLSSRGKPRGSVILVDTRPNNSFDEAALRALAPALGDLSRLTGEIGRRSSPATSAETAFASTARGVRDVLGLLRPLRRRRDGAGAAAIEAVVAERDALLRSRESEIEGWSARLAAVEGELASERRLREEQERLHEAERSRSESDRDATVRRGRARGGGRAAARRGRGRGGGDPRRARRRAGPDARAREDELIAAGSARRSPRRRSRSATAGSRRSKRSG
jgi:hypothetical protein